MTETIIDEYVTDEADGDGWQLLLGDSCERLAEIATASVDFAVYSPPFASLYTYSPSPRDLGNSHSREQFLEHYGYIQREMLRVTKPGRLNAVHVQQLTTTKATHGIISLTDFRGEIIRAHQAAGWIFHGEVTVDKCPQAQAIRTKAQALMFQTLHRDSASTRPALADYILIFRAPGENATPIQGDVDNDTWIKWARPVWYDIRETSTLNARAARDDADERHIAALQLPLIERCVRLWTNRGELVLSPFAGIGSEGVVSVEQGRRFVGIELKQSYWQTAVGNLRASAPLPVEDVTVGVPVDREPVKAKRPAAGPKVCAQCGREGARGFVVDDTGAATCTSTGPCDKRAAKMASTFEDVPLPFDGVELGQALAPVFTPDFGVAAPAPVDEPVDFVPPWLA